MKTFTISLLGVPIWLAASIAAAVAQPAPASVDELAAITQRGRALEAYDQAAWHGTDAARAVVGADTSGLEVYVAQKTAAGWVVDFGKLDPGGAAFSTVLEAQSADGLHFTARRLTPARSDTGFLVAAAHAIQTAEADFAPVAGFPYNVAVLPNADTTMYVYLYPAQTNPNIFPVGGDERFTVSADGLKILDAQRMHNAVVAQPQDGTAPAGLHTVAGVRSVVVASVPQDTDVFHVLARKPAMPDYINAQGQMYLIETDGTIVYKGAAPSRS